MGFRDGQQARRLANAAGRKVSEDTARGLEDTLRAALVDPHAAEALAAGRLTEGMQNSGFGGLAGGDEPAHSAKEPTAAAARSPTARRRAKEQRKRAEYDVEQATSAANKAITARQETYAQLQTADQTVAETGGRVERVRQELEEAPQAQSRAQKDQARAICLICLTANRSRSRLPLKARPLPYMGGIVPLELPPRSPARRPTSQAYA